MRLAPESGQLEAIVAELARTIAAHARRVSAAGPARVLRVDVVAHLHVEPAVDEHELVLLDAGADLAAGADDPRVLPEGGSTLEGARPTGRGGETAGGGSSASCTGSQFSMAEVTRLQDANAAWAAELQRRERTYLIAASTQDAIAAARFLKLNGSEWRGTDSMSDFDGIHPSPEHVIFVDGWWRHPRADEIRAAAQRALAKRGFRLHQARKLDPWARPNRGSEASPTHRHAVAQAGAASSDFRGCTE